MDKGANELLAEVDALYGKAKTETDYIKTEQKGQEFWQACKKEYFESLAKGTNYLWATYYRLLKFPPKAEKDFDEAVVNLLYKVDDIFDEISDLEKKIELKYLKSVISSSLTKNYDSSELSNKEMETMIRTDNLPLASSLRLINSIGLREMGQQNWEGAIKAFKKIFVFSEKELEDIENPDLVANIFSNLGASYIRGSLDIKEGEKYLLKAKKYYLKKEPPSEKHLQGIKNRLGEVAVAGIVQDLSGRKGWDQIWLEFEKDPETKEEIVKKWKDVIQKGDDPSYIIVKIFDDLTDRIGLRQEWEAMDETTQKEIQNEWIKIVSILFE